ncbi:MAG: glycosyltransferase family 4 protein [Candidatus Krumholzibacteriales bacterium]
MNGKKLNKILILSVWEDIWALEDGCGVPDELLFMRGLAENGIEIHYMRPRPAESRPGNDLDNIHEYNYPNIFRKLSALPGPLSRLVLCFVLPGLLYNRIRGIAEEIKPDIILGFSHHSIQPVSKVGRELNIPTAVKLFGVMHLGREDENIFDYYYHNFDQINSLRFPVDHYLVLNDGTMGKKALMAREIPESRITFLQNGMNLEWAEREVDRIKTRKSFGLPRDRVLIITLSRFVKSKRIDHLIRAVSQLDREALEMISLVIAGDGPRRKYLHRLSRSCGLEGKTIFTGSIPYEDVPDIFKSCDIFVGTNQLSNMTMPPCEALLCGLPVVAYDVAGTAEVVRDGETGLLAENGNIDELARRIGLLVKDSSLREKISGNASRFSRKYFLDWEERIRQELETLNNIIGGNRE